MNTRTYLIFAAKRKCPFYRLNILIFQSNFELHLTSRLWLRRKKIERWVKFKLLTRNVSSSGIVADECSRGCKISTTASVAGRIFDIFIILWNFCVFLGIGEGGEGSRLPLAPENGHNTDQYYASQYDQYYRWRLENFEQPETYSIDQLNQRKSKKFIFLIKDYVWVWLT